MFIFLLLSLIEGAPSYTHYGPVLVAPHPKKKDYYLVVQPKPNYPNSSYAPTSVEVFRSMELLPDMSPYATESIIAKNYIGNRGVQVQTPPEVNIIAKSENVAGDEQVKTPPEVTPDGSFLLRPETLAGFRALFPENSKKSGNDSADGLIFTNDKFLGPVFKAKQINIFVDDPSIVHVMSKRFKTPIMSPLKPTENKEEDGSFMKGLNIFKKFYNSF